MASFKDGLNSLFMMAEDHNRRPNIIRGSSSGKSFKTYPSLPQVNATVLKSVKEDDAPLENIVFTSADALNKTRDTYVSTLAVDNQNQIGRLEFDVGSNEFFESDTGITTSSETVYGSDQPLQILRDNKTDQFSIDQSPAILGDGMKAEQEPIIEASLETEEGNFIILMRGGEILSVLSKTPNELDSNSAKNEQTTDLICEQNECNIENNLTTEEQNKGDINIHTSVSELEESLKIGPLDSVTELNADNECYIMVQLPDGTNALVPASALENSGLGDGQFFINTNQGVSEETSDDNKDKTFLSHSSTIMSPKIRNSHPTKQRKRTNTEAQPKGVVSPKKVHKQSRKGGGTTSATTTFGQRQDFFNGNNFSTTQRQHTTRGIQNISKSNKSINSFPQRIESERKPTILEELGPARPFRFDFPDEDSMDCEPSSFLSSVVEAFQKDAENQNEDVKSIGKDLPFKIDPDSSNINSSSQIDVPGTKTVKEFPQDSNEPVMSSVQCSKCSFKSTNRGYLNQHMSRFHKEDLPYSCTKCKERFSYRFLLLDHCRKVHRINKNNEVEECKLCHQQFQGKELLSAHSKECKISNEFDNFENNFSAVLSGDSLGHKNDASTRRKTIYSQNKKIPCSNNACSKWFSDNLALIRHRITVHCSTGPFCCELCKDKTCYDSKEALLKHTYTHSDCSARPYVCEICKRSFMMENHLNDHKRTHFPEEVSVHQNEKEKEELKSPQKLVEAVEVVDSCQQNITASEKSPYVVFDQITNDRYECTASSINDFSTKSDPQTNDVICRTVTNLNLSISEKEQLVNSVNTDSHDSVEEIANERNESVMVNAEPVDNKVSALPASKISTDVKEVQNFLPKSKIQEDCVLNSSKVDIYIPSSLSKNFEINKLDTAITAQTDAAINTNGVLDQNKVNNYTDPSPSGKHLENLKGSSDSNPNYLTSSSRNYQQNRRNEIKETEPCERSSRNEDDVRHDFHALYTKLTLSAMPPLKSKRNVTVTHKGKKGATVETADKDQKNNKSNVADGKEKNDPCSSKTTKQVSNVEQATQSNGQKSVPARPLKTPKLDIRKCVLEINSCVKLRNDIEKSSLTKLNKTPDKNIRKNSVARIKSTNLKQEATPESQEQCRRQTRQSSIKK